MRALLVLLVLQLASVLGDARNADSAPGSMLVPRSNQGNVASSICGYLGGEINQPWVCVVETLYCVVEPNEGVVGCCSSNFCGAFRTACFAQTDPCDAACSKDNQNLLCSGDRPICATYSYASHVTEVRCESTIPTQLSVAYTYSGFSTPILLPRVAAGFSITSPGASFNYLSLSTGTQTPTSSTIASSSSSSPSSVFATSTSSSAPSSTTLTSAVTAAISSNTPSSAASTPPAAVASTSSPIPAGAIVGGVIGGLAIIAAFASLVLWLRYKKHQAAAADPCSQMSGNSPNAFHLSPNAINAANFRKDEQTRSITSEAYISLERDQHASSAGQESELPGETRQS